ncbi:MAG: hypothetical protein JWP88_2217, partial [Flaviaesturariibacter sp.]|nr:hypothetical protein [Flaviaesturariibacter sp.]
MNSRNVIFTLFLALALVGIFIKRMGQEPRAREAFDRHPAHLTFTKHALCRMDCRHISQEDIEEVMQKGIINLNKSDRNDRPCPMYAMQGTTSDGENLRVIFAQCDAE